MFPIARFAISQCSLPNIAGYHLTLVLSLDATCSVCSFLMRHLFQELAYTHTREGHSTCAGNVRL